MLGYFWAILWKKIRSFHKDQFQPGGPIVSFLAFYWGKPAVRKGQKLRGHLKEKHFFLYIWTKISWHSLHIAISDGNPFCRHLSYNNFVWLTFFLHKMSCEFSDGLPWLKELDSCICQIRICSQRLKTLMLLFPFPSIKPKYFIFIYLSHSLFKPTTNQKSWSELWQSCSTSTLRLPIDSQHNTSLLPFSPRPLPHVGHACTGRVITFPSTSICPFSNPLCITLRYFIGRAERR